MRKPAGMKRPASSVNEDLHTDRLKKAAWKRFEVADTIPEYSRLSHQRANRAEKRSIVNNAIVRLPNGSYELCLHNSAALQHVHHTLQTDMYHKDVRSND